MAAAEELRSTLDPGKFILKSSCLDLLAQFEPNFGEMVLRWSSFRIVSDDPHPPTKMAATAELSLTLDPMGNSLKIFSSETTCSIGTKLWWIGP